eukprot:12928171-Prorocentrum_lima.AAC.1
MPVQDKCPPSGRKICIRRCLEMFHNSTPLYAPARIGPLSPVMTPAARSIVCRKNPLVLFGRPSRSTCIN